MYRMDQQHRGCHLPTGKHHPQFRVHGWQRNLWNTIHFHFLGSCFPVFGIVGLAISVWPRCLSLEHAADAAVPSPGVPPDIPADARWSGQWRAFCPLLCSLSSTGGTCASVQRDHCCLWEQGARSQGWGDVCYRGKNTYRPALLSALWKVSNNI